MVNCYRTNQIEVTFNEQVKVDTEVLTDRIKQLNLPYSAANYGFFEESLMIYGLPFGNLDKIKERLSSL